MKKNKFLAILLIVVLALFLRGWDFGNNPAGVYVDEASLGYNAFSLLKTGKDEYGKSFPLLLRSFGTYQSALYSYLSIPIIKLTGLTAAGTRMLSLISGLALVVVVALGIGATEALMIAISPVFIFFSRGAFEANLALAIFISGLLLAVKAKKSPNLLFLALPLISFSAYAYHAERFLSLFFLLFFLFYYFINLKKERQKVITAFALAILIQLPLISISTKSGTNSRLLGLLGNGAGALGFIRQYLVYFSPNNLFSRPDPEPQRSFPELSVFYWWMLPLLVIGLVELYKKRGKINWRGKVLLLLLVVAVFPGAITKEYFSTLRVLPMFVSLAWIIALGWKKLFGKRIILSLLFVLTACFQLYSGLILLKRERSVDWGYHYKNLVERLSLIEDAPVVIDNVRLKPAYILFAFYQQYDPRALQDWHGDKYLDDYYSHPEFEERMKLKNLELRPVVWEDDIYKDQYLAGDNVSISDDHVEEHKLEIVDLVKDVNGETVLRILKTNPEEKCLSSKRKPSRHCSL